MKNKRGFTVVEMLITMAIVGVFIALSLRLGNQVIQKATLTSAINQFMADFNYAKLLASRENRYVAFRFDAEGTRYSILEQREVGADPSQEDSYTEKKTCQPMDGVPCFQDTTNFAINSMGQIYQYPVSLVSTPISISMKFFKAKAGSSYYDPNIDILKTIVIFPTGGIKIETQ